MITLQKRQTRNKLPPIANAVNFIPKRIGFNDDSQRMSMGISPNKKQPSHMMQQAQKHLPISVNMQRRLMKTSYPQFVNADSSSDDKQTATTATSALTPGSELGKKSPIPFATQGRASK